MDIYYEKRKWLMMTVVFVLLIDNIYEAARKYLLTYDEVLLISIVSIF